MAAAGATTLPVSIDTAVETTDSSAKLLRDEAGLQASNSNVTSSTSSNINIATEDGSSTTATTATTATASVTTSATTRAIDLSAAVALFATAFSSSLSPPQQHQLIAQIKDNPQHMLANSQGLALKVIVTIISYSQPRIDDIIVLLSSNCAASLLLFCFCLLVALC